MIVRIVSSDRCCNIYLITNHPLRTPKVIDPVSGKRKDKKLKKKKINVPLRVQQTLAEYRDLALKKHSDSIFSTPTSGGWKHVLCLMNQCRFGWVWSHFKIVLSKHSLDHFLVTFQINCISPVLGSNGASFGTQRVKPPLNPSARVVPVAAALGIRWVDFSDDRVIKSSSGPHSVMLCCFAFWFFIHEYECLCFT